TEVAHRILGTTTQQGFVFLREHFGLEESAEELARDSIVRLFALFEAEPAPLLPGVCALLDRLDARAIPKGIATSSALEHVERVLGPHGLRERFAFLVTCNDVTHGKPHPEVYEKAAAHFGCEPAQMIVFEDSPNGLRAAKAAGARCIVVPHSRTPAHDLALADAIIPSLDAPELWEL